MAHVEAADFPIPANDVARADAGRWEMRIAALCLAQFSEPFFAALAQSQGLSDPPGYARIFFAPVYAFIGWAIWRDRRAAFVAARAVPLILALLGLAFLSTLWSIDSGGTLRRAVWLTLTTVFALYLAWRYDWRGILRIAAGAFLVLVVGSFATALLAPSIGVMANEHPGAWSGLWTHKNTLGGLMAIGAPIGVAAAIVDAERRRLWLGVAFGALLLVIESTSKTALLATFLGVATIFAGMFMRRGPMQALIAMTAFGAFVITLAVLMIFAPQALVAVLGRDLTLTGRTDIWESASTYAAQRPWLGYGYYAFWLDPNGPAYWVRQAVRWQVASAHNGWLELMLGAGRFGIALFALQFLVMFWRTLAAWLDPRAGLWTPAFLLAFGFYTMSESHILQANDLFWIFYVAAAARLAIDAKERM
ncbi:MAG TPA: O-antigen ligase family protein [Caulobacterales bacterium]|nr:O-antigen ligase family protein [Caulobacterales bacterium]